MRRLFSILFWLFDAALIAAFLAGFAARYIPPWRLWWAELVAIALPYLSVAVLLVLILLLLARRWKPALAHTLLVALIVVRFVPFPGPQSSTEQPDDLVLLTFNLPSTEMLGATRQGQETILREFLADTQPDVAAFQEATHIYRLLDERVQLASDEGDPAVYHFAAPRHGTAWMRSMPVLTHAQIHKVESLPLDDGDEIDDESYALRTEFEWQGRRAVHYNVHLQSFKLPPGYDHNVSALSPKLWIRRVTSSKEPTIARAHEARALRAMIEKETLPVIVSGDFNSTAHSWSFRQISAGMTDAFKEAGSGWGATWHARFPFARIDFVLVGPEWEVVSAGVPDVQLSDHRPLVARLRWKE